MRCFERGLRSVVSFQFITELQHNKDVSVIILSLSRIISLLHAHTLSRVVVKCMTYSIRQVS